jgi:hypothetical protein
MITLGRLPLSAAVKSLTAASKNPAATKTRFRNNRSFIAQPRRTR